ncbi:MAG: hypothetical protein Q9167_003514 [Letrouitia subvulpina]
MASISEPDTPLSSNEESSRDHSQSSSTNPSRESSRPPKLKHKVRFTPGGESLDEKNQRAAFDVQDETTSPPRPHLKPRPSPKERPLQQAPRSSSPTCPTASSDILENTSESRDASSGHLSHRSVLKKPSSSSLAGSPDQTDEDDDEQAGMKAYSQFSAQERAGRLSRMIGTHSAPGSRTVSPLRSSPPRSPDSHIRSPPPSPPLEANAPRLDLSSIPLQKLQTSRTYGIEDEIDKGDAKTEQLASDKKPNRFKAIAERLVRHHSSKQKKEYADLFRVSAPPTPFASGQTTPVAERDVDNYVQRPDHYREGFLSAILKLYNEQGLGAALSNHPVGDIAPPALGSRRTSRGAESFVNFESRNSSPERPGATTPKQKWYYKNQEPASTGSIGNLVSLATQSATALSPAAGSQSQSKGPRPSLKKSRSISALDAVLGRKKQHRQDQSVHIQVHIAETMSRQAYLMKMCRALMNYGAPTHRLEEQMRMSARVLEIEGQFLYIPGCMIISFDDSRTHTTEVKIVRTQQFIDLGKLREVHDIYKETLHDIIGVDEAMERLDACMKRPQQYPRWMLVLLYGAASAFVGPFAFGARPIDLPIAFLLGCCLGFMQLILAPKSELYSNIFEVTAAVLTSFLARAFGSINGGDTFCFSALAQSAIALILPGYTVCECRDSEFTSSLILLSFYLVVCGALELQSRNILAGSVRMVYAIIYSLFLGYGITIGTSFYGGIDSHATSAISCQTAPPNWFSWIFVPPFTLCLIIINQGKWKQMPAMIIIAFVGYVVNRFSAIRFSSNAQIANTLGALAVGVLGNLYSRLRHGVAAAALLPAIWVQVPSGLAASGSLVSGVRSADQITNSIGAQGITTVSNATQTGEVNDSVFTVGYSMVQVAIGITVGLFLSALVVYPLGKRRSGLFSF